MAVTSQIPFYSESRLDEDYGSQVFILLILFYSSNCIEKVYRLGVGQSPEDKQISQYHSTSGIRGPPTG